jgi:hypothetical protein
LLKHGLSERSYVINWEHRVRARADDKWACIQITGALTDTCMRFYVVSLADLGPDGFSSFDSVKSAGLATLLTRLLFAKARRLHLWFLIVSPLKVV